MFYSEFIEWQERLNVFLEVDPFAGYSTFTTQTNSPRRLPTEN